jgi:hypothetical protein
MEASFFYDRITRAIQSTNVLDNLHAVRNGGYRRGNAHGLHVDEPRWLPDHDDVCSKGMRVGLGNFVASTH